MNPSQHSANEPFLELLISRGASGYDVRATSNHGQARGQFVNPFSSQQLELVEKERFTARLTPRAPAGDQYIASDSIRATGHALFKSLIREEIHGFFVASYNQAAETQQPFRLQLVFDAVPELEDIPWEYIYSVSHHLFVSVAPHTPLVRSLPALQPIRSLQTSRPLKVLVVASSPGDAAALDVERECDVICTALHGLKADGLIDYDLLRNPTLLTLTQALIESSYHLVHFIAHGEFDEESGKSFLLFEDEFGTSKKVSANQFSTALRSSPNTRLIVLNACNTARPHESKAGGGMCQTLLTTGTPAVVAMADPISDQAGKLFAQSLYESIARGEAVDVAVNRARLAVYTDRPEGLEWATPVLYMRSQSGQLFDLTGTSRKHWWHKLMRR